MHGGSPRVVLQRHPPEVEVVVEVEVETDAGGPKTQTQPEQVGEVDLVEKEAAQTHPPAGYSR